MLDFIRNGKSYFYTKRKAKTGWRGRENIYGPAVRQKIKVEQVDNTILTLE